MEMVIDFPGGARVDAHFGQFTVKTDQPPIASAPTPFATFLAVRIVQRMHSDMFSGMVGKIDLEIQVPPTFPEKYLRALVKTAELCAVKKHFENPPKFDVFAEVAAPVSA